MPDPLVSFAEPCPRCGSRRLLVTAWHRAEYNQEVEVGDDGSVTALGEPVNVCEEPDDLSSPEFLCTRCGYSTADE